MSIFQAVRQHKTYRTAIMTLLLVVILLAVVSFSQQGRASLKAITTLSAGNWAMILGLSLLNYALRFWRWQGYLAHLGHVVPMLAHIRVYLAGFAFTTTPGKLGEGLRCIYLQVHGVSYSHSLAAFFTERFMDLLAMIMLAALIFFTFQDYQWVVVIPGLLVLILLLLIRHGQLNRLVVAMGQRLQPGRLRLTFEKLGHFLQDSRELFASRLLTMGLTASLLAWGAEGIGFWYICHSLDIPLSLALGIGIYALAVLAGVISFVPGGLGGTEAVMIALLILSGASADTALAATLVCRVATLWFAVIIGLLAWGGLEINGNRRKQTGISHE